MYLSHHMAASVLVLYGAGRRAGKGSGKTGAGISYYGGAAGALPLASLRPCVGFGFRGAAFVRFVF
jgi:hypothetical protein